MLKYRKEQLEKYREMLKAVASLSKLSSESSAPYLGYRQAENIYCLIFNADNISRVDCSADAFLDDIGLGIKTFLENNGRTMQKVAEFNKDMKSFSGKTPREIVRIVSHLRNERIESTKRIYGLKEMVYHCIVRSEGKIKVFECPMDLIDIKSIKDINVNKNTILFRDNINEYSINLSKSTLYKRFITNNVLMDIDVDILENPYDAVLSLLTEKKSSLIFAPIIKEKQHVFLPLYSDKGGKRNVPEKSGLNQWNASGRKRNPDEVYIPIPAWIHRKFPDFFPKRDQTFELVLPDKNILSAKVCQDGGKALMTNPNLDLGKWILRKVMNLAENELLTYERLEELDIDSVVIYKESEYKYSIDFTAMGSYDQFKEEIN